MTWHYCWHHWHQYFTCLSIFPTSSAGVWMVKTQVFPSPSLYAVHAAWLMDGKSMTIELTFPWLNVNFGLDIVTLNSHNLCIKVKCEMVNLYVNLPVESENHFELCVLQRQVLWAKGSRLQSCPTRGTRIRSFSGLSRAFPLNCPLGNWKFKFIWQRTW